MADLIDRLPFALAGVEAVGSIEDPADRIADISIGVDHSRWDDNRQRIGNSAHRPSLEAVGCRCWPGIPQNELKITGADEGEIVGLIDVFMGPTGHPGLGLADVGHHRVQLGIQFVLPVEFDKPATGVGVAGQGLADDPGNRCAISLNGVVLHA